MTLLTSEQLNELAEFDTPTVANAIELFDIQPRTQGFMSPEIKCIIGYEKPMVGYACTATIASTSPPTPEQEALRPRWLRYVHDAPRPSVAVLQDIDEVPLGAFWGEVQSSIHTALGCVGTVTNGGVRDLDEVKDIGFGFYASCIQVSHAYVHLVDYDIEVSVGGLKVKPGDLIHADKHGVLVIPPAIADKIADACRKIQYYEEPVIKGCRERFEKGISIEELERLMQEMARRRKTI